MRHEWLIDAVGWLLVAGWIGMIGWWIFQAL